MIPFAGLFGAASVLAGAFGAHALKERLAPELLAVWNTGAHYHLVHAVVLLVLGFVGLRDARVRTPFFLIACGTGLFSGSLYALALSGARSLGAITPVGGLLMVAGWASLAWLYRTGGPNGSPAGLR